MAQHEEYDLLATSSNVFVDVPLPLSQNSSNKVKEITCDLFKKTS